ncbi:MAG TPA: FadR/GntR family transcriptional regulator [Baekduia sp.]|nr:FadR/GntR family transcriptional regulator [Baekduia sp.]
MTLGRQTLSQAISAAVLERIRSGEFGPGDRLPTEKMLMEEYGVGRNSVREAVQALVTLGLVEVRPGRGATVLGIESAHAVDAATISVLLKEKAVDDLYAFRRLLEVETAQCAARHASDADIQEIESCLRAYEFAYSQHAPLSRADDAFHAAVAQASQNRVYATMLDAVSGLIANARRLTERVPWAIERTIGEHGRIFEAIKARDPEAAAAAMRRHMESASEAIEVGRRLGGPLEDGATPAAAADDTPPRAAR